MVCGRRGLGLQRPSSVETEEGKAGVTELTVSECSPVHSAFVLLKGSLQWNWRLEALHPSPGWARSGEDSGRMKEQHTGECPVTVCSTPHHHLAVRG